MSDKNYSHAEYDRKVIAEKYDKDISPVPPSIQITLWLSDESRASSHGCGAGVSLRVTNHKGQHIEVGGSFGQLQAMLDEWQGLLDNQWKEYRRSLQDGSAADGE